MCQLKAQEEDVRQAAYNNFAAAQSCTFECGRDYWHVSEMSWQFLEQIGFTSNHIKDFLCFTNGPNTQA